MLRQIRPNKIKHFKFSFANHDYTSSWNCYISIYIQNRKLDLTLMHSLQSPLPRQYFLCLLHHSLELILSKWKECEAQLELELKFQLWLHCGGVKAQKCITWQPAHIGIALTTHIGCYQIIKIGEWSTTLVKRKKRRKMPRTGAFCWLGVTCKGKNQIILYQLYFK